MPVNVGRDTRLGVASPALDRVDRCAIFQQDRDGGMAQVMEANVGQTGLLKDLLEGSGYLGLVDVGADGGGEDHTVFFPIVTSQNLLALLLLLMLFEQ